MAVLLISLILFFLSHTKAIIRPVRNMLVTRLGDWGYKAVYSGLSLVLLVAIVIGFGEARHNVVVLYAPPIWARYITLLLMIPVFPLLILSVLPGKSRAIIKNPMLSGLVIWAVAHLIANGELHSVVLFGSFLIWVIVLGICTKRYPEMEGGQEAGGNIRFTRQNDIIALIVGLAIYGIFVFWGHLWLIGISPI